VVHVEGDGGKMWQEQGHGYVPQAYFFGSKGQPLHVEGPMAEYKHFFANDSALADGMKKALVLDKVTDSLDGANMAAAESTTTSSSIAASGFNQSVEDLFLREQPSVSGTWPSSSIQGKGKPVMVLLTQSWCGACKGLKASINNGSKVSSAMKDFDVVHVEGDGGKMWQEQGHGYVPQAYFFGSKGQPLHVEGPMAEYKHFFANDSALADGMKKALVLDKAS